VKVILNNPKIILYNIAFSRGRAPNNPVTYKTTIFENIIPKSILV
jgi:hypothetical protein